MEEKQVQLLDANTANQIAAGEVVEKPASVVKELVENALDADATQITVTIYAGGTEYIRVEDNGSGMSEANARMAILRHATSKLHKAEDLLSLGTLGFRGEALPSIASVSRFTLLTRTREQDLATCIKISGGTDMEVSETGGSPGTTVMVEDLFFNVPARRKFLKTIGTEGRYINELLTKLSLSRPDVRFKLLSNDKEVLSTPGDGQLLSVIRALYGKNTASELLPVEFADYVVKISGYIGKPTLLKNSRQWQTFFVNGRCISNKMLAKAMDHAYQSQIPKSGFPFAVLSIEVDRASVDVNVHPQKSEIKFSDDGIVYRAMYKALTDALTKPMQASRATSLLGDSALQKFVPAGAGVVAGSVGNAGKSGAAAGKLDVSLPLGKAAVESAAGTNGTAMSAGSRGTAGNVGSIGISNAIGTAGNVNSAGSTGTGGAAHGAGSPRVGTVPERPQRKFPLPSEEAIFKEPEPVFKQEASAYMETAEAIHAQSMEGKGSAEAVPNADAVDFFSDLVESADSTAPTDQTTQTLELQNQTDYRPAGLWSEEQLVRESSGSYGSHGNYSTCLIRPAESQQWEPVQMQGAGSSGMDTIWPIGQVDKTFIIAQSADSLYLIDQHAAHERILYDKLVASHETIPSQQLLMPLYLDVDKDDLELVEQYAQELAGLGVDASAAGEELLRISSLPADLKADDAKEFIQEICQKLGEQRQLKASDLRQELLHMTACKAAIKAGQLLNMRQMRQLIIDLCNTEHPFTCPHGRPCMIELDSDKLYKMFKRTGF